MIEVKLQVNMSHCGPSAPLRLLPAADRSFYIVAIPSHSSCANVSILHLYNSYNVKWF